MRIMSGLGIKSGPSIFAHSNDACPVAADFLVTIHGQPYAAVIESVVTAGRIDHLTNRLRDLPLPGLLVADRIADACKQAFRRSGVNFCDLRGELRVVAPGLFVDAADAFIVRSRASLRPNGPLDSPTAMDIALVCLETPNLPHGVREISRKTGRSPSSVSVAMRGLKESGLMTSVGEPVCPDLFHAVLERWHRKPVLLSGCPLSSGEGHPFESDRWVLADTLAAVSWGIPIIATGDYPPDFYVPTISDLQNAVFRYGESTAVHTRACTVAVAPSPIVCQHLTGRTAAAGDEWPIVSHIVAALDVASDKARGFEALMQWKPEGIVRAW